MYVWCLQNTKKKYFVNFADLWKSNVVSENECKEMVEIMLKTNIDVMRKIIYVEYLTFVNQNNKYNLLMCQLFWNRINVIH